mmetsp:Transcript_5216/g.15597  ORF Transcript_5216/g.15597 Transcript_5216/m.15597 type:complete len:539 (+) Transcript_5216:58-1674(+)
MGTREEMRKKAFKKAIDPDEARRKRGENAVEIRKSKREDNLMKKRMYTTVEFGETAAAPEGDDLSDISGERSASQLSRLPKFIRGVFSDNIEEQFNSTVKIRELLSMAESPPIHQVVQGGVVPAFVQFLMMEQYPKMQFEAAWALTNIASGTSSQTQIVIEAGAVPVFVRLLSATKEEVREQAVWALGNIAGDGPACRNLVLDHDALDPLLTRLREATSRGMLRNLTWALSNLCRGKPPPKFRKVRAALPMLASLVRDDDEEVIADACWALSYLSDGDNNQVQEVIEMQVVRRLVELLNHEKTAIQIPALRTIGNIVTGNDDQTQVVIRFGALPALYSLLSSERKSIRKEACWTISNITAGNKDQVQAVLDCGLFPPIIYLLKHAEFDVKKEAAWAISNATYVGSAAQVNYLVDEGCIEPLCGLLRSPDQKIIDVCLDALEHILKVGEKQLRDGLSPYAVAIEEHGGLDSLEALQHESSSEIYSKVVGILIKYFRADEDEVQGVAPVAQNDHFQFESGAQSGAQMPSFNFEDKGEMFQ